MVLWVSEDVVRFIFKVFWHKIGGFVCDYVRYCIIRNWVYFKFFDRYCLFLLHSFTFSVFYIVLFICVLRVLGLGFLSDKINYLSICPGMS